MATLRIDVLPAARPVKPLPIADEQVSILRVVARREPGPASVELEDGLLLEHWEQALLHREARANRDIRGEALTLLRARAAEWAVRRRLRHDGGFDAGAAAAAVALLDRTLAEIGTTTEFPECRHLDGLEQVARRLQRLYEQVADESLRLAGLEGRPAADQPWRVDALEDDAFELGPVRRRATDVAPTNSIDHADGDDPFGLESQTVVATGRPASEVAAAVAPGRAVVMPSVTVDELAFELADLADLQTAPTTTPAATAMKLSPPTPRSPAPRAERAVAARPTAASPPRASAQPASLPQVVAPTAGPRAPRTNTAIIASVVVAAVVAIIVAVVVL